MPIVPVPVVLFVYARVDCLVKTLECLKANKVPLLYIFSDAPRSSSQAAAVAEVRALLRSIDWCQVILIEREKNLGLGRSIVSGVSQVLKDHGSVIVFEDDLIFSPATYRYFCSALDRYKDDLDVMSITGWTHPRVTPKDVGNMPYFDGRAECWGWATWRRAWVGMENSSAKGLLNSCRSRGIDICKYGADLVAYAFEEKVRNTWAVRWLYHHILKSGLCLRPPRSMVKHIGFDQQATNAKFDDGWDGNIDALLFADGVSGWPRPVEQDECAALWRNAYGSRLSMKQRLFIWRAMILGWRNA